MPVIEGPHLDLGRLRVVVEEFPGMGVVADDDHFRRVLGGHLVEDVEPAPDGHPRHDVPEAAPVFVVEMRHHVTRSFGKRSLNPFTMYL